MSELRPELLRLLDKARADHEPSPADQQRVRAAVYAAVGMPLTPLAGSAHSGVDALAQAAPSPASSSAVGALSGGAWTTVAKVVLGLAVSALGLWTALPEQQAASAIAVKSARPTVPDSLAAVEIVPALPSSSRQPRADENTSFRGPRDVHRGSTRVTAETRHVSAQPPRAAAAHAGRDTEGELAANEPANAPSVNPADEGPDSAAATPAVALPAPAKARSAHAEILLIRAALTALNRRDPERALLLLQQHQSEYPEGVMGEEREGLRIIALCEGGRFEEGRRESQVFLRNAAHSPLSGRLRSTCWEQSK
jgi:hypothetical protein